MVEFEFFVFISQFTEKVQRLKGFVLGVDLHMHCTYIHCEFKSSQETRSGSLTVKFMLCFLLCSDNSTLLSQQPYIEQNEPHWDFFFLFLAFPLIEQSGFLNVLVRKWNLATSVCEAKDLLTVSVSTKCVVLSSMLDSLNGLRLLLY